VGNFLLLVGGDVITRMDQVEVKDADELIKRLRERKPGETINLTVLRDGKFRDVKVLLQERPKQFRR
jgi:S1-C subfamily serine protease